MQLKYQQVMATWWVPRKQTTTKLHIIRTTEMTACILQVLSIFRTCSVIRNQQRMVSMRTWNKFLPPCNSSSQQLKHFRDKIHNTVLKVQNTIIYGTRNHFYDLSSTFLQVNFQHFPEAIVITQLFQTFGISS